MQPNNGKPSLIFIFYGFYGCCVLICVVCNVHEKEQLRFSGQACLTMGCSYWKCPICHSQDTRFRSRRSPCLTPWLWDAITLPRQQAAGGMEKNLIATGYVHPWSFFHLKFSMVTKKTKVASHEAKIGYLPTFWQGCSWHLWLRLCPLGPVAIAAQLATKLDFVVLHTPRQSQSLESIPDPLSYPTKFTQPIFELLRISPRILVVAGSLPSSIFGPTWHIHHQIPASQTLNPLFFAGQIQSCSTPWCTKSTWWDLFPQILGILTPSDPPKFLVETCGNHPPSDHWYASFAVTSAWLLGFDRAKTTGRSATWHCETMGRIHRCQKKVPKPCV